MTWQPIETAPKDGTEILLFGCDGIRIAAWCTRHYRGGIWNTGYANEVDGDPIEVDSPTHWMPLPELPTTNWSHKIDEEGRQAFRDGAPVTACPYPREGAGFSHSLWFNGWHCERKGLFRP